MRPKKRSKSCQTAHNVATMSRATTFRPKTELHFASKMEPKSEQNLALFFALFFAFFSQKRGARTSQIVDRKRELLAGPKTPRKCPPGRGSNRAPGRGSGGQFGRLVGQVGRCLEPVQPGAQTTLQNALREGVKPPPGRGQTGLPGGGPEGV